LTEIKIGETAAAKARGAVIGETGAVKAMGIVIGGIAVATATEATTGATVIQAGDGNGDWRNRRGDGRRGNWRYDERRRREWSGSRLHRRNEWSRHRRHRSWWTSRYSRFALFGGGYYYWNSGYWYPAYGYDPYFSTYTYDAPIYSYDDQDPGQVIANVQQALQQQGYYQGELDGSFGPLTRQALLDYQRDNGLPVTGEIDQDTLARSGLNNSGRSG
jgi:hypothetical protein